MNKSLKITFYSVYLLLLYVLQFVAVPLSYNGVAPDLLLLFTVTVAIREGGYFGSVYGLVAGLLSDFAGSGIFGARGVLFCIIGCVLGLLSVEILSPNILTALVSSFISSVTVRLLLWGGLLTVSGSFDLKQMLVSFTLPELIMTIPLIVPVFLFTYVFIRPPLDGNRKRRRENNAYRQ